MESSTPLHNDNRRERHTERNAEGRRRNGRRQTTDAETTVGTGDSDNKPWTEAPAETPVPHVTDSTSNVAPTEDTPVNTAAERPVRERRSRDRYGRDRRSRQDNSDTTAANGDTEAVAGDAQPVRSSYFAQAVTPAAETATSVAETTAISTEVSTTEVAAVGTATAPAVAETVETAPAATAVATTEDVPSVAAAEVTTPAFELPLEALQALARAAGLEWVQSDANKVAQVQAAIAAEPQPVHVPREPKPVVLPDEGPLVLVETRRDLRELQLPFEATPAA